VTGSPVRRMTGSPGLDPEGGAPAGPVLVLRPHRVLVAAWVCAVATVAVFTVVAVLLRNQDTGVYFRFADQVAMVLLGVLIAAGILLLARPRVRADAAGIEIRNVGSPRYLPWHEVRAVSFPDGASWARVDLPYYEYVAVMAVQAVDGERAVTAMRRLRALHGAALAQHTQHDAATAPDDPAPERPGTPEPAQAGTRDDGAPEPSAGGPEGRSEDRT
jgi:hypothetical protein